MQILSIINLFISIVFLLCYFYQIIYIFVAYIGGVKKYPDAMPKRLAVLIAARNEERVIENLITSLLAQDYPREAFDVFVIADNCTDSTASVARVAGAKVYERFNKIEVGKGYALDALIKHIERDYGEDFYDAYMVFDADNTLEPNYLTEINKAFSAGYDVVTTYRNASNYGKSWRAGGQGMYFIRDARVLNLARTKLGVTNYVTGTGFLFSSALSRRYGGWPFHTLTEDGEFTMHNAVHDAKCAYAHDAIFYDEQAVDAKTSFYQQLRWCKGGLQIFKKYLPKLIRKMFSKSFLSAFDVTSNLVSAYLISTVAVTANVIASIILLSTGTHLTEILAVIVPAVLLAYLGLLVFSIVITITDYNRIHASAPKKILYIFTFPLFVFSFIPPAFVALFKNVEWKETKHGGENTYKNN